MTESKLVLNMDQPIFFSSWSTDLALARARSVDHELRKIGFSTLRKISIIGFIFLQNTHNMSLIYM